MDKKAQRPYDRTSYILIVDDDSTILKFFKIHLNKFFSKVIVVKNAAEAMATIKEKDIDLVISDVVMPRTTGFQLMKKIRKHDITIPVLIVTGAQIDDDILKESKSADGFLKKPFSMDQLHEFIELGMDKRDKFKHLQEFIEDKEIIKKLLKSKIKVDKVAKPQNQKAVQELIKQLA